MANRFITDEVIKIDLGDGDYIEIKKEVSYWEFSKILDLDNDMEKGKGILLRFVKGWNLKDEAGLDVPCTEENILRLSAETLNPVMLEITKLTTKVFSDAGDVKKIKKKVVATGKG